MPRCSAFGCRNMGSHTFPKDPFMRKQWEEATNKEKFKASKHSRLCSGHFKENDYIQVCESTGLTPFHRYLKKTAVPSIFSRINQTSIGGINKTSIGDIETLIASRQQMTRHLRKGVVPSIFPWTKTSCGPTTDSAHQEKDQCKSAKKNDLEKNSVPDQDMSIKQKDESADETKHIRDRSVRLRNRKAYLENRKCSVPHCNTRPSKEVSLHPCPNNAAVRNEWAEALNVSFQYVKNMVACSLHFMKTDFIQSKNGERVLKQNAVPSRNLPHRNKVMVSSKSKTMKKVELTKAFRRQKTMTDTGDGEKKVVQEEEIRECRACLKKLDDKKSCCYVFQAWAPPWAGMEATIAEDLAKLAHVEISKTDRHSKVICAPCYQKLLDAATFAASVRGCDYKLRKRFTGEIDMEKVWPKPIQVDKNINGSVLHNANHVEIKQEVLSDEEYPANPIDNPYAETVLPNLDIKIEPEELVEPHPMNITINGTISLDPLNSENKGLPNGVNETVDVQQETEYVETAIKQEPTSEPEGEQEVEQPPDLPLECLLCTKSFNSVTGLKAHVIAQHSYKSVKRKWDGSVSPERKRVDVSHKCAICRRCFQTPTDLMVHETCHNKHVCYGCTEKFDSFELLTRHRKRCKAAIANSVQKLKTLEDVKRPLPEEKVEYLEEEIDLGKNKESGNNGISIKVEDSKVSSSTVLEKSDPKEGNSENDQVKTIKEEAEGTEKGIDSKKIKIEDNNVEKGTDKDSKKTEDNTEDSDSNMELHLEIHSTKRETVSKLGDADMQVETLKNDNCT